MKPELTKIQWKRNYNSSCMWKIFANLTCITDHLSTMNNSCIYEIFANLTFINRTPVYFQNKNGSQRGYVLIGFTVVWSKIKYWLAHSINNVVKLDFCTFSLSSIQIEKTHFHADNLTIFPVWVEQHVCTYSVDWCLNDKQI